MVSVMVKILLTFILASCVSKPTAPVKPPEKPPTLHEKWLIIGDSHSDYYGNARGSFGFMGLRLSEILSADLIAVSGSTPSWFLTARPAKYGCTVNGGTCKITPAASPGRNVIVEQGANMIGHSGNSAEVDAFLTSIRPKKCYWVGPISAPRYLGSAIDRAESEIKAGLKGRCTYINSRSVRFENGHLRDNEHMSQAAYEAWAELVSQQVH